MKKILALILCLSLVFGTTAAMASADNGTAAAEYDTPTILVPGFLQSYLYTEAEDGEKQYLFPPEASNILKRIIDDIGNFMPALFGLFKGDFKTFGYTLGTGIYPVAGALACNPDGTSMKDIKHYDNSPENSNAKSVIEQEKNGERSIVQFQQLIDYVAEKDITSIENLFIFEYDSRLDSIELAERLRDYIKAVKAYTGKDKVNIFTVSYGGLIASTYLYYYMNDGDVSKVVMTDPALGGTNFPAQVFSAATQLPLATLIDFVEVVLGSDTAIFRFLADVKPEAINEIFNAATSAMAEIMVNWSSVWALTMPELYNEYKQKLLDETANAAIIERNDIIHYEIMPEMSKTLNTAIEKGIDVSIVAGYGNSICLGGDYNSDILLPTEGVTGAVCSDMGTRFEDGYTAVKTTCTDESHNHISPSMEVDASAAYLPENTWFIDGHYHAMYYTEDYYLSLVEKLLFTDELENVHSDENYPQFEYSDSKHRGIHLKAASSNSGYIADGDTITLTNVYGNHAVKLLSVTCDGADITFDTSSQKLLRPGEKAELTFSGTLPKTTAKSAVIKVKYLKIGLISTVTTVDIPVMIDNCSK